jgi:hypothetical protein
MRASAKLSASVLVHVVLPLVVGVVAYVAWRTSEVRVVTWLPRVLVVALRDTLGRVPLPRVVAGSLPDAAWGWAFGAALAIVWRARGWREKAPWLGAGAALAIGVELGQAAGIVPGTFDWADLVSIAIGYTVGAALAGHRRDAPAPAPP